MLPHRALIVLRHCPAMRSSAVKRSIGSTTVCTITEKAATRAFSWLKAPTSAFTFKTLLRHYAKWALTPRSLNVKLGPRRNYHKGFQPGEGPSRGLLRDYEPSDGTFSSTSSDIQWNVS